MYLLHWSEETNKASVLDIDEEILIDTYSEVFKINKESSRHMLANLGHQCTSNDTKPFETLTIEVAGDTYTIIHNSFSVDFNTFYCKLEESMIE